LIREWGTLRKWLDEDRESLRLHRHLTESTQEWQRRGREPSELYRGTRLKQIQEWMKGYGDQLSPLEREFLKASQNVKSQERLRWVALSGVGVMLVLAAVLAQTGTFNFFIYRPVDMQDYWVTIPAGEFQMGSSQEDIQYAQSLCSGCDFSDEQPQHTVFLDEYQIGKYEVTNRQYAQCVKATICRAISVVGGETELHPVVDIDWYDAKAFCEWMGGRLPTEAEWEKAASWDDQTKTKRTYPWGKTIDCTYANYYGKDGGTDYCVGDTTPVGSYESGKSPYGLYDMAGNVQEWVDDWYSETYYQSSPSSNPLGPDSSILFGVYSNARVLRGGAWRYNANSIRSALRGGSTPTTSTNYFGFRCARDISP